MRKFNTTQIHISLSFDATDSNVLVRTMALASIRRSSIVERTNMDQPLSQSSERRRQPQVARSQSIKILRNNSNSYSHFNCETDESARKAWEEDISQLEEQYESATIQMYYRITEYRMRNSFYYSNATSTESTTPIPTPRNVGIPFPSSVTIPDHAYDVQDSSATNATYISEENGAIFEMDL